VTDITTLWDCISHGQFLAKTRELAGLKNASLSYSHRTQHFRIRLRPNTDDHCNFKLPYIKCKTKGVEFMVRSNLKHVQAYWHFVIITEGLAYSWMSQNMAWSPPKSLVVSGAFYLLASLKIQELSGVGPYSATNFDLSKKVFPFSGLSAVCLRDCNTYRRRPLPSHIMQGVASLIMFTTFAFLPGFRKYKPY